MASTQSEIEILLFDDALEKSHELKGKRHVLLGNGFSIACRPDCFTYDALLNEATFLDPSFDVLEIFDLLETTDFEKVIDVLRLAATLADAYKTSDPSLSERLRSDAEVVRNALAQVLAANHPDLPYDIEESEYLAARQFLRHFERVYTLNYDMLLYWTIMKDLEPAVPRNDGFTNPVDLDADYVAWEPYRTYGKQRVFFLHGGLHLYDNGAELAKITWSRTEIPLLNQIRQALDEGRYPLIVTEGSAEAKATKILHNANLTHAIRSFSGITGSLFLYGLSLADNDEHLLQRIVAGKIDDLFVSIYGEKSSAENQQLIHHALTLADERASTKPRRPLEVHFFDASSANVWG